MSYEWISDDVAHVTLGSRLLMALQGKASLEKIDDTIAHLIRAGHLLPTVTTCTCDGEHFRRALPAKRQS